jgi:hypothetical protein
MSIQEQQQKPRRKKKTYLQRYSDDDKLIAEAVFIGSKAKFAIIERGKDLRLEDHISEKYYPDGSDLSRPYIFKSEKEFNDTLEAAKYHTFDTLYAEVLEQWKKFSCASQFENELCAVDTIFTYYEMVFGMTHYVFFIGSPDSGKSNKLLVFNVLGYRNFMSSDMTPANIYRHLGSVQEGQGTICEDEAEELDEEKEKMRIYKVGYTSGIRVPRNDKEGLTGGLKQSGYFTYGFKVFAAEHSPDSTKSKAFNSRTIPINCISDTPDWDISEVMNPANSEEFALHKQKLFELRNLLFCHMLIHCHDKFDNINLNITNREKQLFKPLLRLFQGTKTYDELLTVTSHFVNERRRANTYTLLSVLYNIICELVSEKGTILESRVIWNKVKDSIDGSDIPYSPQSYDTPEFGIISSKKIIDMAMDNFKGRPPTHHGTSRKLMFNIETLEQLESKYTLSTDFQVAHEDESGTDGTHGTHSGETNTDQEVQGQTSTTTRVHSNNVSQVSQNAQNDQIRAQFDPSKVGHIKNNLSQVSQNDPENEHLKRVKDRYDNL